MNNHLDGFLSSDVLKVLKFRYYPIPKMVTSSSSTFLPSQAGQPAWEIARLFPEQGGWTDGDYLLLNRLTNRFAELSDGMIEVLEMPTLTHQRTVARINELLLQFIKARNLGTLVMSPYPVQLWEGKFREPDLIFVATDHLDWLTDDFARGADLVVEVVSRGDPGRDWVVKRAEYAKAKIAEYWIVDPQRREIAVLKLTGEEYEVHGLFHPGDRVDSALLNGLGVQADDVFSLG